MEDTYTHFPWRENNRFDCLRDGVEFYPAMLRAIRGARDFVAMEMYLVQPGRVLTRFVDALLDATRRHVRVYLLLDDFGVRGLAPRERHLLNKSSIHVCYFNPLKIFKFRLNLIRDHRKVLLVDDRIAFVGGAGISDSFDVEDETPWRDNMLRIEGDCARDWQRLFASNWKLWSRLPIELPPRGNPSSREGLRGRVVGGQYVSARELRRTIVNHVRKAQRRVWISSAYFLPPLKLNTALRRAARRGVDVRLLVPGEHTDHPAVRSASQRFYLRMLHAGIRIFEYQPRFMHAKTVLCDDLVSMGSCNLDRWSLRWNLEANQEIEDAGVAAQFYDMFQADVEDSIEITLPAWLARSYWSRIRERLWGWLETWLVRRSYRAQLRLAARSKLFAQFGDMS
ncbi:MAG: phosphatidylserine/phosphatidylglycerophosphate/cardiolipin synthase family protein [Gammaproteobacteria bacterium]|nr:phosphatidylserine/phosphatidylglycerophosphate/cardiolipin synthase family protein [Gammaproteobacteria bacterium]